MSSGDRLDIDAMLSRSDKWYLGGGDRLVWTPRYPAWLDAPGFWDEAHYQHLEIAPVFTWTLLDEQGDELAPAPGEPQWQPSHIVRTLHFHDGLRAVDGLHAVEERSLLPDDVLACTLRVHNETPRSRELNLVAWTMIPHDPDGPRRLTDAQPGDSRNSGDGLRGNDCVQWTLDLDPPNEPPAQIGCALGLSQGVNTAFVATEEAPFQPKWMLTPFYDDFRGGLPDVDLVPGAGPVYAAVHTTLKIPAGESVSARACFAAAPTAERAGKAVQRAAAQDDPTDTSRRSWSSFFEALPQFTCSSSHLETYYWYRWYGLRLFARREPDGNYRHPAVFEGPGYFRKHVTYSAQCHMLETRWMRDPSAARGSLLNFIENQRPDGSFIGHLFTQFGHDESFYHADWGNAWDVHLVHADKNFLETAYGGLSRYAEYFQEKRDPDDSGLYDILNHYETGQEYMHRYVAVDESADQVHWGENFRLKGVDAAVYMYETKRFLARAAQLLNRSGDRARWQTSADRTAAAIRERMWDADAEMFSDLDGRTGERTGVKAAVCFYPYMTDIVREEHLTGLKRHLLSSDEFWTAHPVPSSSLDDPYFKASPFWKGRRMNCPWNGRSWPMANSHVAEALAQSAIRFNDDELRTQASVFIERFIRMMFFDESPDRPNCFEHYNPLTGKASVYRGFDDYQHSWVVDLIIKYVCGIRPQESRIIVDPFPFDLERFRIERVPVRGHEIAVERTADRFRTWLDGRLMGEHELGEPIRIDPTES